MRVSILDGGCLKLGGGSSAAAEHRADASSRTGTARLLLLLLQDTILGELFPFSEQRRRLRDGVCLFCGIMIGRMAVIPFYGFVGGRSSRAK